MAGGCTPTNSTMTSSLTARSSRSLGTNLTMKHSQNLSSSWKEHELVFLSEMY